MNYEVEVFFKYIFNANYTFWFLPASLTLNHSLCERHHSLGQDW